MFGNLCDTVFEQILHNKKNVTCERNNQLGLTEIPSHSVYNFEGINRLTLNKMILIALYPEQNIFLT